LIQRKNKDSHTFVMYPRIGGGKFLSNLAAGGSTMPIDIFLEENFGQKAPVVKEALEDFALRFPPLYQNFLKQPFFDIGLDIGIEKRKGAFKLWLFEVNVGPQFAFSTNLAGLHMTIARATLECYKYLHSDLENLPKAQFSSHPSIPPPPAPPQLPTMLPIPPPPTRK